MRRLLIFCAIVFALTLGSGAAAGAQAVCGSVTPCAPPTDVAGEGVDNDGDVVVDDVEDIDDDETEVAGDVTTRGPAVAADTSGQLPVTGGDLVGLTAMGLGAMALGGLLVIRRRRTAA